jgi:hypothetical protein
LTDGKLGGVPPEYEVFELALLFHRNPEEIRRWALSDIRWIQLIRTARAQAEEQAQKNAVTRQQKQQAKGRKRGK